MTKLARTIGFRSAVLLVVSSIVGSGVFKKVAPMAAELAAWPDAAAIHAITSATQWNDLPGTPPAG